MKKIITAIVISLSTLAATSAMADWDHDHHHQREHAAQERVEWREGVVMPDRYHNDRYHADYRSYKNLHKPGKYERWYKVDGRYVLVNEQSHHVIRVVN